MALLSDKPWYRHPAVILALVLAWGYKVLFPLLFLTAVVLPIRYFGLAAVTVVLYLILLPYIGFLGVLPSHTLLKAIHTCRPSRMLWWMAAMALHALLCLVFHLISWSSCTRVPSKHGPESCLVDDDKFLHDLATRREFTVVLCSTIAVSEVIVLWAYCVLRGEKSKETTENRVDSRRWSFTQRGWPEEQGQEDTRRKEQRRAEQELRKGEQEQRKGEQEQRKGEQEQRKGEQEQRRREEELRKGEQERRKESRRGEEELRRRAEESRNRVEEHLVPQQEEMVGKLPGGQVARILSSGTDQQVLQLPGSATQEEVKAAYRHLALSVHPDKNPHPRAGQAFARLQQAYSSLSSQAGSGHEGLG